MNSLSLRVALQLCMLSLVLGLLVVIAAQAEAAWLQSAEGLLGAIALALAGAWLVLRPTLRRMTRLADALDAYCQRGFKPRLALADPHGDEVSRLAARVEELAELVAGQARSLERAGAQRRELLANMAHDLRTPLASMQGYLELMLLREGTLEPAEAHNYLQTAARQSERLSRLVRDLFELTRLEAGELQPQPEAFALAELAQDVVQKFAGEARRREVTLCTSGNAEPSTTWVQADIGLIERVLDNLVDNALRHTPAGGRVTIEMLCEGQQAGIAVRDNGDGLAAEPTPEPFEHYERSSRVGSTPAGAHAGLGLAIARRIVGLHGSQLLLHSAPGQGTQVSFALALAETRPVAPQALPA